MTNQQVSKRGLLVILFFIIALVNHVFHEPKIAIVIGYIALIPFFLFEVKDRRFLFFLLPLIFVLLSGFIFSFKHNSSDVLRDIFYFLNPVLFMFLGAMYAINLSFHEFLKMLIRVGTLLSLIFIIQTLFRFGLNIWENQIGIRTTVGVGNSLSVFTLALLLFSKKYSTLSTSLNNRSRTLFIIVNFVALILFGSRTYWGIFIISIFCLSLPFLKTNIIKYLIITALLIAGLITLINSYKDNVVIDKFISSLTEIVATNDIDKENIYANFRGYETLMAFETYKDGNTFEILLGQGFGKLIDLKTFIELGGEKWRHIPVLHNGFTYLLVKTGIIGLFFFFFFFYKTLTLSKFIYNLNSNLNFLSLFTVVVVLTFLLATGFVAGIFNVEFELQMILLGSLIQYQMLEKFNINNYLSFYSEDSEQTNN